MKKWMWILAFIPLLFLSGCEVNDITVHDFYTMPGAESDIAALLFLGGNDEAKDGMNRVKSAYFSHLENHWPEDVRIVQCDQWAETYLLVPKYTDTILTVVSLDSDGFPLEEMAVTGQPILLRCNYSDVVRSIRVTVRHLDREVVFQPFISPKDGLCAAADGIYTEIVR